MALHNANTVIVPCCTVLLFFAKAYNGVIFAPFCPFFAPLFLEIKSYRGLLDRFIKKTPQR